MQLTPAEVFRLTFVELEVMLEAARRRDRRQQEFQAAMTANLMNCHPLRRAATVERLLGAPAEARGRRKRAVSKDIAEMSPGEQEAQMQQLFGEMEKQAKRGE